MGIVSDLALSKTPQAAQVAALFAFLSRKPGVPERDRQAQQLHDGQHSSH